MSHALDSDVTQVSGEALTLEQFTAVWDEIKEAGELRLPPELLLRPSQLSYQTPLWVVMVAIAIIATGAVCLLLVSWFGLL